MSLFIVPCIIDWLLIMSNDSFNVWTNKSFDNHNFGEALKNVYDAFSVKAIF